ncbi:MAG: adenylate/guanylate cyclase domain-containing protein [Blastochloris sp.]|nr:adenylate/guanylate cyclase domain-containing protein [Blastochloris sp.]
MEGLAQQVATLAAFVSTPIARAVHAGELPTLSAHAERIPAAVLFADISGFTALTEALAINNPNGSEQLTALLNLYFTHMIVLLESYGGQVVKFSGDAISAIFVPEEHASDSARGQQTYVPEPSLTTATVRAAFAAISMQRAMDDFQQQATSMGSARLGLKVGVGSGTVLTAHVGGVFGRWEYLIAGDAIRQAVQAQEQARRGMVVLSPQAAARVGSPDAQGQVSVVWSIEAALTIGDDHPLLSYPQPYRVLQHPLDWSWLSPEALQRAHATLRAYVPAAIASRLQSSQYEWVAELRRLTIMFVGVGGIDYLREHVLDQLQPFIQSVQEIVYRYEGSLNKVMVDDKGTVLLILFGAPPLAHEDDALRALACAHDLQASFDQQPGKSERLAIGITNATVFAGPVGSTTRGEYTVMGDAVNLAARLMQQAGAGGTLCDTAVYKEGHRHWGLEELPPLLLKGKAHPVQVYHFRACACVPPTKMPHRWWAVRRKSSACCKP